MGMKDTDIIELVRDAPRSETAMRSLISIAHSTNSHRTDTILNTYKGSSMSIGELARALGLMILEVSE